ncbi:hypothetical protein ACRAWD_30655 [Caulobacter segnis]
MITIDLLDARGRPVPTADDLVRLRVSGPGRLIGVGNGDPNSLESDKASQRRLFNGLAQAIVQSTGQPGRIIVEAVDGLDRSTPLVAASLAVRADAPTLAPASAASPAHSLRR